VDLDRIKDLAGICENDTSEETLSKISKGISNYVSQEKDHRWPYGFERKMAKFILAELEKEDTTVHSPQWGDRT